jgi:hypothetical protein
MRNGKEIFAPTLEKVNRGGGVKHGSPPLLRDMFFIHAMPEQW